MYVNFLSTYSDKKSCRTSTTLQTSIVCFVSDSWASCKCWALDSLHTQYISWHWSGNCQSTCTACNIESTSTSQFFFERSIVINRSRLWRNHINTRNFHICCHLQMEAILSWQIGLKCFLLLNFIGAQRVRRKILRSTQLDHSKKKHPKLHWYQTMPSC